MADEAEHSTEVVGQDEPGQEQMIENSAAAQTAEEGSSANLPDDAGNSDNVIASFTETQGEAAEVAAAEAQATEEEEGAAAADEQAEAGAAAEEAPASSSKPASRSGSIREAPQVSSRPGSSAEAKPASKVASPVASKPASPAGSKPMSPAGSKPTSAAGSKAPSRPGSGAAAAPIAVMGSKPSSAVNSPRPGSQAGPAPEGPKPASPAGSKPASRPASSTAPAAPAPGSRPPSGLAGAAPSLAVKPMSPRPMASPTIAGSSRPSSATQPPAASAGSRPGSQPAAAGSRPASQGPPRLAPGPAADVLADPPVATPSTVDRSKYIAPNLRAIDVEVQQGPGLPNKMIRVLMDYSQQDAKPYLGGYRHKKQPDLVYHHAWTQTPKQPKYKNAEPKLERTTQTVKTKTRSQQTMREAATQMERPGVLLDTSEDRVRTPGPYQTADEWMQIVERATRTIQRYVRGWFGRRRAAYLRQKKIERETFLKEQDMKAQQEAEEHRRKEIERRMHPRTAADFEILYNELEAWRLQETRKIKEAGLPKEKEQEVLQQLLHKETKLLQTIDRLKINANHENKEIRVQNTLGDMAKPKRFELKNGNKVEVHTPFTTRARELQQLYNGLNMPNLSIDERMDVLLHVKWTVKEFDCNLTRELVDLIDREADLINRGRAEKTLEGLRKRISSLFLNFIETPEFNPESARFQIVPMDFEHYLFEKLEKSTARSATITATGKSKFDF